MSVARLPTIPITASGVATRPPTIVIIDDDSDNEGSNACAGKRCANPPAAKTKSLHQPFKKERPFHDIIQSLVGYNSDDDRKMPALPNRKSRANDKSLSANEFEKLPKRRKLSGSGKSLEQITCLYCGACRQVLESDVSSPCPDCHAPTGINEMTSHSLTEEESIIHMLTRENQEMVEHEGMLQTAEGRAILFAKEILKIDPLPPSARSQGTDTSGLSIVCMPVGEDDMVFLAIKLFKLQQEFLRAGKSTHVRLAYHYTSRRNLHSIKENGLMSMNEQNQNPGQAKRLGPTHGAVFGDGVYCACNPFAFRGYGDCGLLVAILMGEVSPRMASRMRVDLKKPTTDTVLGNKRMYSYDQSETSSGITSYDKLLFQDEIVLRKSDQVLPLLQYDAADVMRDPDAIWIFQGKCQEVVDKFFNRGVATKIHRYEANEPPRVAAGRLQPPRAFNLVGSSMARATTAASGTSAATPQNHTSRPSTNGAFPSPSGAVGPGTSSVSLPGAPDTTLKIQQLEKKLFEGMKRLADIPSQRHRALQMLKQQSVRLQQQLSTSALGIQLGQNQVKALERELKNLETTMSSVAGSSVGPSANGTVNVGNVATTQTASSVTGSSATGAAAKLMMTQFARAGVLGTPGKSAGTQANTVPSTLAMPGQASAALSNQQLFANAPGPMATSYVSQSSIPKLASFTTNSQRTAAQIAVVGTSAKSPSGALGAAARSSPTLGQTPGSANFAVPSALVVPPLAVLATPVSPSQATGASVNQSQQAPAPIVVSPSPVTAALNLLRSVPVNPGKTIPTTLTQQAQNQPTPTTPEVLQYAAPEKIAPSNIMEFCHRMRTAKMSQECPICLETLICSKMGRALILKTCGHFFHSRCIETCMQRDLKCPVCRKPMTEPRGRCPSGSMTITGLPNRSCGGHDRCGTIEIRYLMGSGIQKSYHTNPGKPFGSTSRTAYIPDNEEGRKLLKRLKYAWLRGLTFDVGTSLTTGRSNTIVWASIHHKTTMHGGAHGFPDLGFFFNCNDELDALNVPKADQL